MRQVDVELKSTNDDVARAVFRIEARESVHSGWKAGDVIAAKSGEEGAKRSFLLNANERLVIETDPESVMIVDPGQSSGVLLSTALESGLVKEPVVESLEPATAEVGGEDVVMTVHGTDFRENSVITFGGVTLETTYEDETSLSAIVTPSTGVAGMVPVGVSTGPVQSNTIDFEYTAPVVPLSEPPSEPAAAASEIPYPPQP